MGTGATEQLGMASHCWGTVICTGTPSAMFRIQVALYPCT